MPGDPIDALLQMRLSYIMRNMKQQVCQPEAESPPSSDFFAASSSMCIGWLSNSRAYSTISSRVIERGPKVKVAPSAKSS
jgi:hypothetical protein